MIAHIVITAIFAFCAIQFINYCKKMKDMWKKAYMFDGPKPLPIIGNALDVLNTTDIIPAFQRYIKESGPLFRFQLLTRPFIICAEPESVECILSSNKLIDKSMEYTYLQNWLGLGLLTSSGNKWRKNRKIITPTFHFNILEQYISIFDKCSTILANKLQAEVSAPKTDIYPFITLCTLDVICETAMGLCLNSQNNENNEYVEAVREIGKIMIRRSFSAFKQIDVLYKLSKDYRKEKKCLKILNSTTESVINKRKQYMMQNLDKFVDNHNDDAPKKKMAFLDMLLQINMNENNLSDQDIKDEVATFMFEGHDTTSSAVCFTLYCLAQYPEIQKIAMQEVNSIFGDDKLRPTTYNDIQSMKYLEMVIKESIRLYPTVPMFSRCSNEDAQFKDKIFPKGVTLLVYPFGLHRHPKYFPNPEKFDPDRFTPENQSKRPAYSYVPFSAGPRNCIGQKFAMIELKCIISKVLRNYELKSVPNFTPELSVETVLKSSNGIFINFGKR